jgi:predicted NAD/FAD-dependent oxidoreductase
VFDKGRRPGGRIATRRTPFGCFDHGAQYFTANDARFRAWTEEGKAAGMVARWDGAIAAVFDGRAQRAGDAEQRWVGVPGMSGLAAHLAASLAIRSELRITGLVRNGDAWWLLGHDGAAVGEAKIVIFAVPAPQAVELLRASPRLATRAAEAILQPCWALMLGYATSLSVPFDGAFVNGGPLAWICRNTSKPGRTGEETWVLHASSDWSHDRLEDDEVSICEALREAFAEATGVERLAPAFIAAHRWRYARVATPLGMPCLFDDELAIGACGDWCLGANIEAAFRSGQAMAETILAHQGVIVAASGSS